MPVGDSMPPPATPLAKKILEGSSESHDSASGMFGAWSTLVQPGHSAPT